MKIIHSFWSKPLFNEGTDRMYTKRSGGWTDKWFNYLSWCFSCLQFKKHYDEVELVTDKYGKELLIDLFRLPYTRVSVVLDALDHYHHGLWALGKLVSYQLQKEPFIHADGDVYIWEKFSPELENAALVAQNLEHPTHYRSILEEISCRKLQVPHAIKWFEDSGQPFGSINAGIIGGNDVEFIKHWVKEALSFVDENLAELQTMNISAANIYFEQYLFYCMSKQQHRDIHFLLHDVDEEFSGLADLSNAPLHKKYMHAVGIYKRHELIGQQLADQMHVNYPDHYYRVRKLLYDHKI